MYDFSNNLRAFHDSYVRLTNAQRADMRKRRDTNCDRVTAGLDDLGKPKIVKTITQGGYAQKTMVQPPEGDDETRYDIDMGIVFNADDAIGARGTRIWVRDAIAKKATNMKNGPECKPKCVRVTYSDGYQCDFPVFRRSENGSGFQYELSAGEKWVASDPASMNDWIDNEVAEQSPEEKGGFQLRRVIRYIKYLAKVRAYHSSKKYPGGLLATALAVDCYIPNEGRDDVSLRETLRTLGERDPEAAVFADGLQISEEKDVPRLKRLIEDASKLAAELDKLESSDADMSDARKCWKKVFRHSYFNEPETETKSAVSSVAFDTELQKLEAEAEARRASGPRAAPWCDREID